MKKQMKKSNAGKIKLAQEETEVSQGLGVRTGVQAGATSFRTPISFAPASFIG
jgi:hypothetical protein